MEADPSLAREFGTALLADPRTDSDTFGNLPRAAKAYLSIHAAVRVGLVVA